MVRELHDEYWPKTRGFGIPGPIKGQMTVEECIAAAMAARNGECVECPEPLECPECGGDCAPTPRGWECEGCGLVF